MTTMRLRSTMKSSPFGCAATLPSTPIIRHVRDGTAILQFPRSSTGCSCCAKMALLHTVSGSDSGRSTSILISSETCQSRCVSCQLSLVYRRNLIVTISDGAWDNLKKTDTQKWLRTWVLLCPVLQEVLFIKSRRSTCGSSRTLGGPKRDGFSH